MAALLKLSTLQFVSVTTLDDCSEVCLRSPMCNSHVSAGHVQYSQQMLLLPPSKVRIIPKATFGSLLSARPSHDASLVSLDDCSDGVRWSCYHCSFLRLQMGQWQCLDGILAVTTKSFASLSAATHPAFLDASSSAAWSNSPWLQGPESFPLSIPLSFLSCPHHFHNKGHIIQVTVGQ